MLPCSAKLYSSMGSEDEAPFSWARVGIHSGVTVWNVLFSECAPPILPSAGGLLSLLSLAVELPRSGARLFCGDGDTPWLKWK